jgi:mannose-6-phosphate isomerase
MSFVPKAGDGVFIPAGTVNSLDDVVVFEVQENSDVTFRLYDWDHLHPRTGRRRPLQADQAIACIDFHQGAIGPVTPVVEEATPVLREKLFHCTHFGVTRNIADFPFVVGETEDPGCRYVSRATVSSNTPAASTLFKTVTCCWLRK